MNFVSNVKRSSFLSFVLYAAASAQNGLDRETQKHLRQTITHPSLNHGRKLAAMQNVTRRRRLDKLRDGDFCKKELKGQLLYLSDFRNPNQGNTKETKHATEGATEDATEDAMEDATEDTTESEGTTDAPSEEEMESAATTAKAIVENARSKDGRTKKNKKVDKKETNEKKKKKINKSKSRKDKKQTKKKSRKDKKMEKDSPSRKNEKNIKGVKVATHQRSVMMESKRPRNSQRGLLLTPPHPSLEICDQSKFPTCDEGEKLCMYRQVMDGEFQPGGQSLYYIDYSWVHCMNDTENCSLCTPGRYCKSESRCVDRTYNCSKWW